MAERRASHPATARGLIRQVRKRTPKKGEKHPLIGFEDHEFLTKPTTK